MGTLSTTEWLAAALEQLAEIGRMPKIAELCEAIGRTKGSFYGHFASLEHFKLELLGHWRQWATARILDGLKQVDGGPKEKLRAIMNAVATERLWRYEAAVRSWALDSPEAAEAVEIADRRRHSDIQKLFAAMGFEGLGLEARTRAFVATVSTDGTFPGAGEPEAVLQRWHVVLDLLTSDPPERTDGVTADDREE